jgi:hypothetical protein
MTSPQAYKQQGADSLRDVLTAAHASLVQAGEWVAVINVCDAKATAAQISQARVLVKAAIDGLPSSTT